MSTNLQLSAHDLHLTAGGKVLCKELNWQLEAGQAWAVLGLNGAGKTTLLHTLAGIQTPDAGEIKLADQPMHGWSRRDIAKHIGLLLQESYEPFPGTVLDYVLIGRHPHLHAWQWESETDVALAKTALQTVGLDHFATREISSLSGGERQRMAIAAVLVQQPDIFLLDEPVNHLDWHHQHQLLQTFSKLVSHESKSMVMAIHDVNLADRYCDHVLMIFENGEIKSGTTEELLQTDSLSKLYGYPVEKHSIDSGSLFVPG